MVSFLAAANRSTAARKETQRNLGASLIVNKVRACPQANAGAQDGTERMVDGGMLNQGWSKVHFVHEKMSGLGPIEGGIGDGLAVGDQRPGRSGVVQRIGGVDNSDDPCMGFAWSSSRALDLLGEGPACWVNKMRVGVRGEWWVVVVGAQHRGCWRRYFLGEAGVGEHPPCWLGMGFWQHRED